MNRDEILARNRAENEGKSDERELQIFADASKVGMAVGGILAAISIVFGLGCFVGMIVLGLK